MSMILALAQPLNDDTVSPGLLGTAVFAALCVAVYFLIRSMTKQIKKIEAPSEAEIRQREWERTEAAREGKADADDREGGSEEPAGKSRSGGEAT